MEKRVPLFYRGIPVGSIEIADQGSRCTLRAECPGTIEGLLRAYAGSAARPQGRLLIGVMEPEQGRLSAQRIYTKNDLRGAKIALDEIDTGELIRYRNVEDREIDIQWKVCHAPERLFRDVALKSALREAEGILVDDLQNPRHVAAPLRRRAAFCLAPAFCLVKKIDIDGESYGLLEISEKNDPICPMEMVDSE